MASVISRNAGSSASEIVLGSQVPRYFTAPVYISTAGPEAIDLARLAGIVLDEWQQQFLAAALGETPSGRWAALEGGLCVARQNGKSAIAEVRQLTGLFLLEEPTQVYSAHLGDTVTKYLERLETLIEGTPEFSRRVRRIIHGNGRERIELHRHPKTGRAPVLGLRTRSKGGGLGYAQVSPLYLDEAQILSATYHGTILPVIRASPNPQTWYMGTAVNEFEQVDGLVLAKVRARGIGDEDPNLLYMEFSPQGAETPDDVTPEMAADPRVWAEASPALGTRVALETMANEQRSMGHVQFCHQCLNVGFWPDITGGAERVISEADWAAAACRDESMRIDSGYTFGLDGNVDNTRGSIAVAGKRPDGLWHFALGDHRRGVRWMLARCEDLAALYPDAQFVVDVRGPVKHLLPGLREAGIPLIEASADDYGDACAQFVEGVVGDADHEGSAKYPDPQPELSDAVKDARKQRLGDRWKWSRRNSTSADISPVVAASLALWGARTGGNIYATLITGSPSAEPPSQQPDGQQSMPAMPVGTIVLDQSAVLSCFRCREGYCPIHGTNTETSQE